MYLRYCTECKIGIFIEGNFKYICTKHTNTKTKDYFNIKNLSKLGHLKRKTFIKEITNEVKRYFTIGECCIKENDYPQDFQNSIFFSNTFGQSVISKLKKYEKANYTRINYQNCINPALNMKLCEQFKKTSKRHASKFDIDSAFISCLTHLQFLLPTTIKPKYVLVNRDADIFFKRLDENDLNFAFVKLFCIPNKNECLPFFPYYSIKHGIQYTNCSVCCEKGDNTNNCKHSDESRGYFVETYLTDALYYKKNKLGDVRIVQIIYFDSKHNEDLSYLANMLITYRKSKTGLEKLFTKQIALAAIGHFAFNVEKHCSTNNILIDNYHELSFKIESNKIKNIDFYDKVIIAREYNKLSTYKNSVISARLNCSSLLFGQVNNAIRRELFDIYLMTKTNPSFEVLRFDTDALIISYPTNLTQVNIYQQIFNKSQFNYKIEFEDIQQLTNLKQKSHFLVCKDKTIMKIPGLSLSVSTRNNIYNNGIKSYNV